MCTRKRALILADLEGVTGLYSMWNHAECVRLMTSEMEAVTTELFNQGITEITVCDIHDKGDTIDCSVMEEKGVQVVSQFWNLDLSRPYDLALLTGFHAMRGFSGYFPHTFRRDIRAMHLSQPTPVGEIGFFVTWLALHQILVMLLTGDQAAVDESRRFNQSIPTCAVKELGSPEADSVVYDRMIAAISSALTRMPPVLSQSRGDALAISFVNEDICALLPDRWQKEGNRLLFSGCDDFVQSIAGLCSDLNRADQIVLERAMAFIAQAKAGQLEVVSKTGVRQH